MFWKKFVKKRRMGTLDRLVQQDPTYRKISERQKERLAGVKEILCKLTEEDRKTIRFYNEQETLKLGIEFKAVYIQGLKDCLGILALFGMFDEDQGRE